MRLSIHTTILFFCINHLQSNRLQNGCSGERTSLPSCPGTLQVVSSNISKICNISDQIISKYFRNKIFLAKIFPDLTGYLINISTQNISRPCMLCDPIQYSPPYITIYNLQMFINSALFLCLFSGQNFVSRHYILNITFSILCLQALHSQHALDPHQSDMCPTHSLSPYQGLQFKNLHTFTIFDTFLSVALS